MADTPADTITIRVEVTNVADSAKQIERITNTLERLSSVANNLKTNSALGEISSLLETASNVSEGVKNLNLLTKSLRSLSKTNESFNVSNVVNGINDIGNAIRDNLSGEQAQRLADMAEVLRAFREQARNTRAPQQESQALVPVTDDGVIDVQSEKVLTLRERLGKLRESIAALAPAWAAVKRVATPVLGGIAKGAKAAAVVLKHTAGAPVKLLGKAFTNLKSKVAGFFAMFKKRLMYRAINAVISAITNAIKEGVNNVYQYSKAFGGTFSQSMDRASTSLLYFKNSVGAMVAPLINMLVPALEWVIEKVVAFINVLNQLFARMSGASTWTRALMYPKEYAEATNKATKAAKKWKATILGIDELNLMADNSPNNSGGASNDGMDYSKMFEEVALTSEGVFGDFFAPLKAAWEKEGKPTIDAIKRMLGSFRDLFKSIGHSFAAVWQNGTGQKTLETIFKIIQGIARLAGNLADSFRRAWDENETGTRIVQAVWDILNSILGTIQRIIDSTAEWAANLDFGPLLTSLATFLEKLKPLIDLIGQAIEWLWNNIVLPVLGWLIETQIPDLLDGLGGICDFLVGVFTGDWEKAWEGIKAIAVSIWNSLWEHTIKPIVMWVYEEILVPIGDFFVGLWNSIVEGATICCQVICDAWNIVTTWFNESVVQPIVNFFVGLWEDVSGFFKNLWEDIKRIWKTVSDWFNDKVVRPVANFFSGLWDSVSGFFTSLWDDIKGVWNTVSTWFDENVIQPVSGFFEGLWESVSGFFTSLWEDIKGVWETVATWFDEHVIQPISGFFEGLWDGIKGVINSILGGIESFVNFFVDAINWIIKGLNKISFDIPDWVPLLGGNRFGFNLKEVAKVTIPRLAEGGTVATGTMFVAGEAGPEIVAGIGNKSGVMNVDQMEEAVRVGMTSASHEQNTLLRQILALVANIDDKEFMATISTGDIHRGLSRANRRDGVTVVPVAT